MRGTVGRIDKFEAMLATGLAMNEVVTAMVAEGIATDEETARILLEELSSEDNDDDDDRRSRRSEIMKDEDASDNIAEILSGEHLSSPSNEESKAIVVEETSPEAFFTALLRDEITTTPLPVNFSNDRSVHGSISSRMSESQSRGQEQKRRRRTTSQPPANISMKKETKKRTRSLAPYEIDSSPVSPPLAEKLRRMESEIPSRFKSDKRLLQEKARATATASAVMSIQKVNNRDNIGTLTIPASPTLRTARRSRGRTVQQDDIDGVSHFFKALALDPKILHSSGDYGVPRVVSAPTTSPKPFAFATDSRLKQSTVRKPPPLSNDEIELAKNKSSRRISKVSSHLFDQPRLHSTPPSSTLSGKDQIKKVFRARPAPTNSKKTFTTVPSTKPLTKPEAPKMPGMQIHAAARAKLEAAVHQANRRNGVITKRLPLASVAIELNSDRRARERKAYDDALLKRRQARELDKSRAEAAIARAKDAELKRQLRTSTVQGGLHFIARPISARSSSRFIRSRALILSLSSILLTAFVFVACLILKT